MKIINKAQISYVICHKATEGIRVWGNEFAKRIWMEAEYFKFLWLFKTPLENYGCGYYKDCKRKWITNDTPHEIDGERQFVLGDSIYTHPHIQVFCGAEIIHTEYFKSYRDLEEHIKDNYSNCSIRYE
jgi:hypothetical protein